MTEQNENNQDEKKNSKLDSILCTVRSIDGTVDEILDTLTDHFDANYYDSGWDRNNYVNGNDY